jgi:hypothetical protein
MKKILLFSACLLGFLCLSYAQNGNHVRRLLPARGTDEVLSLAPFEATAKDDPSLDKKKSVFSKGLKDFSFLKLRDYAGLRKQVMEAERFDLTLPAGNKQEHFQLWRHQLTAPGFVVETSDGNIIPVAQKTNNHFIGVKKGTGLLAAFSFNPRGVTGFFSDDAGNHTLQDAGEGLHIFYSDADILEKPDFRCHTPDDLLPGGGTAGTASKPGGVQSCKTVRMYIECTYAMFQAHNNDVNEVVDYVFTMFNASSSLFLNDGINIQLSEIFIWNQPDIYTGLSVVDMLFTLKDRLALQYLHGKPLNGDIAHVITPINLNGGVSNAIGLSGCGLGTGNYSCAASSSIKLFPPLPLFSYAIFTFTHETGHMLGSPHTQSCQWPGGPIDNCAPPEGTCAPGPPPLSGGTIMSYCYNTPYGINFSNGFGPLPAALIKSHIESAACIRACGDDACVNRKVEGINVFMDDALFKIKWINNAPKYRIAVRPNTSHQWQYYEVTGTDSFLLIKTRCDAFFEYSIAPFCAAENRYGTAYSAFMGNANAIKLNFRGLAINTFICAGDSAVLSVKPDTTLTYHWYLDGILQPQLSGDSIRTGRFGRYTVTADLDGCTYYSDTVYVKRQLQTPVINATINNTSVDFRAFSNCSVRYLWDFGDGIQSTSPIVTHNYAQKTTYTVTLKVWDADDNMESASRQLFFFNALTDSLDDYSKYGVPLSIAFEQYQCSKVARFSADSFNLSTTLAGYPRILYSSLANASVQTAYPKNGTLELKLFPQRGLIKTRAANTQMQSSDTGYVLNINSVVLPERDKFFLNFSKWGGIQVGIDSVKLGNVDPNVNGPLELNKWNNIGISYGRQGIQLWVNGTLYAASNHIIDSAHSATLGSFNFGTHIGRPGHSTTAPIIYKGFEGALDKIRFSFTEQDFTFSRNQAWQGKDTVIKTVRLCYGGSYDGYVHDTVYFKENITAEGCDSVTQIRLHIYDDITIADSIRHVVDGAEGTIFINNVSGGLPPLHFLWQNGDTTRNLDRITPGTYSLKITDSIGCEKIFPFRVYGLAGNEDYIVLLPNPVRKDNSFTLRIGSAKDKQYTCIIYDATGRKCAVRSIKVTAGVRNYEWSTHLPKGTYLLKLAEGTKSRSLPFVVI